MTARPRIARPGAFLLVAVGFLSLGVPDAIAGVAWPGLRDATGMGEGGLGWLLAASGLGYISSSLVAARFTRLLGLAMLLVASCGLVAGGLLLTAALPPWTFILAAAVIAGWGSGAIDASLNMYASVVFPAREVNWLHAAYSVGAAAGPFILTLTLTLGDSWRAGYIAVASIMISTGLLFFVTRRAWHRRQTEIDDVPYSAGAPVVTGIPLRAVLRTRLPWLQILTFYAYVGCEVTLGQWGFSVLREHHGVGEAVAGASVTAYWVSIAAGRVILGAMVDRIGPDRMLRWCIAGAAISAAVFATAPEWVAIAGLVVAGFCLAPIYPTLMARTPARMGATAAGEVVGLQASGGMVGAATIPALAGFAAAHSGVLAAAVVGLGAAVLMLVVHEVVLREQA